MLDAHSTSKACGMEHDKRESGRRKAPTPTPTLHNDTTTHKCCAVGKARRTAFEVAHIRSVTTACTPSKDFRWLHMICATVHAKQNVGVMRAMHPTQTAPPDTLDTPAR